MCVDTPRITGDFSAKVQFVLTGLESCQNYRIVITAVTAAGKKSLETIHVATTGFEGWLAFLKVFKIPCRSFTEFFIAGNAKRHQDVLTHSNAHEHPSEYLFALLALLKRVESYCAPV